MISIKGVVDLKFALQVLNTADFYRFQDRLCREIQFRQLPLSNASAVPRSLP